VEFGAVRPGASAAHREKLAASNRRLAPALASLVDSRASALEVARLLLDVDVVAPKEVIEPVCTPVLRAPLWKPMQLLRSGAATSLQFPETESPEGVATPARPQVSPARPPRSLAGALAAYQRRADQAAAEVRAAQTSTNSASRQSSSAAGAAPINWAAVGSRLSDMDLPAELVAEHVVALDALAAMTRGRVPHTPASLAAATAALRDADDDATPHAPNAAQTLFPLAMGETARTSKGCWAVFPPRDQLRAIDRVQDDTLPLARRLKRLARRADCALDALADMRDMLSWTDAQVIAVHNTFQRAAATTNGGITIGLAGSMPLPLAVAWPGGGDVQRDPCLCPECSSGRAAVRVDEQDLGAGVAGP
jgi:hypothetical protein